MAVQPSSSGQGHQLYPVFEPQDVKPKQDDLVDALYQCVRFRFHEQPGSTPDAMLLASIEFEDEEKARKAQALFRHSQQLGGVKASSKITMYLLPAPDSSVSSFDSPPPAPAGSKLLHISELPPTKTAGDVYDVFIPFGPIYSCSMLSRGQCALVYYTARDADAAVKRMNYEAIDSYQILVRAPSVHDQKNSFRNPRQLASAGVGLGIGQPGSSTSFVRRTVTEQGLSSKQPQVSPPSQRATSSSATSKWANNATTSSPSSAPSTRNASAHRPGGENSADGDGSVSFTPARTAFAPVRLTDPTRLVVHYLPTTCSTAQDLFALFSAHGSVSEASVARDPDNLHTHIGVGLVKFDKAAEAGRAMKELDGKALQEGGQPLRVRLWEWKGPTENRVVFQQPVRGGHADAVDTEGPPATRTSSPALNKHAKDFVPEGRAIKADELLTSGVVAPSSPAQALQDLSFTSSSGRSSIGGTPASFTSDQNQNKHRKLLLIALSDLDEFSSSETQDIATKLAEGLSANERMKCVFDEAFLKYMAGLAREGKLQERKKKDDRRYDRKELLGLYSPTDNQIKDTSLVELAHAMTAPRSRDHSPTLSTSPRSPTHRFGRSSSEEIAGEGSRSSNDNKRHMDLSTVVRFSVKGIIDLAESEDPPDFLKPRDGDKVRAVDDFLRSIEGLKVSQQKQKIGEKVFKLFKAVGTTTGSPGGSMTNISKKTVALLDQEDLSSLMHCCEEFPEILCAKAMALQV